MAPLFTATAASARQLGLLLRCISFAKKVAVRISGEGVRFSVEDGSAMEAFVFLEKALFTTYAYTETAEEEETPVFEISLDALLETLNIFSLSDPTKRPDTYDALAAHRLNRHAGVNAFANYTLGTCTITYDGPGSSFSVSTTDAGVATTADLTTYDTPSADEIPFNRDVLALKTILPASNLLDAVTELGSLNPDVLTLTAVPTTGLDLHASGPSGSASVAFASGMSETPILETFHCPGRTSAGFKFAHVKAAVRAMAVATKVSVRVDGNGVLSLQFLVEVEVGGGGGEGVAFVDFRVVSLVEGDEDGNGSGDEG